ncbi:hypothetical protein NDU88_005983 [Pleurodeles waltl]|uniref:Uncharacterized protein n=1 Tax=Pleurodeles waltl TaxID=8319 RepID=A0AAV7MG97_PLEWA|nr:hypothetical protein NDU88_005983 [Pleurodeles waltl]
MLLEFDEGSLIKGRDDITDAFAEYYGKLYGSDSTGLHQFVANGPVPCQSPEDCELLDAEVICWELRTALGQLPVSKAPGPNTFLGDFWLVFRPDPGLPQLNTFKEALALSKLPHNLVVAEIIVLPKPGLEGTKCEAYQLISLLNSEVKIWAKVLANE